MTKLKDLKARLMEDAEFREEYARVDEEYALIEALVRARTAAKLTQAELAQRLGTTQSAVARLEGGRVSPSFATLRRYAEATGTRLTVGLVPVRFTLESAYGSVPSPGEPQDFKKLSRRVKEARAEAMVRSMQKNEIYRYEYFFTLPDTGR